MQYVPATYTLCYSVKRGTPTPPQTKNQKSRASCVSIRNIFSVYIILFFYTQYIFL